MAPGVLVRYGSIAEVARFANAAGGPLERGERVVIRSHRGIEIGTLLEPARQAQPTPADDDRAEEDRAEEDRADDACAILRAATADDERAADALRTACERQFADWRRRIDAWQVKVELVDLEATLDKSKLILYVLNERGPDCTRLALEAAAAGLGIVEVQPVGPNGLVPQTNEHGCGSGGCGSGGNGGCCG